MAQFLSFLQSIMMYSVVFPKEARIHKIQDLKSTKEFFPKKSLTTKAT